MSNIEEEEKKEITELELNEENNEKENFDETKNEEILKYTNILKSHSSFSQLKKKKSFNRVSLKTANEIDVILEIYTKVTKKEDAENCICHNFLEIDFDEIKNHYLKSKAWVAAKNTRENNQKFNNEYIGYFYEREIISSMPFYANNATFVDRQTLKLLPLDSCLKVALGQPLVKNAEHTL